MLSDSNIVKLALEDEYRAKLGGAAFRDLMLALKKLDEDESA